LLSRFSGLDGSYITYLLVRSQGIEGSIRLDRKEAVTLLKELIVLELALPSLVSFQENRLGKFDLIIKADCISQQFIRFIAEKKLVLSANKERGYCIISEAHL